MTKAGELIYNVVGIYILLFLCLIICALRYSFYDSLGVTQ